MEGVDSTYIILVPPNPSAQNGKFEMMKMEEFMQVASDFTMVDNIEKLKSVTKETQTTQTPDVKNNKNSECNKEVKTSTDIGINTISENTIFNKRSSSIVLPVQRSSVDTQQRQNNFKTGKVSLDEYRRRTSFEEKANEEEKEKQRELFKTEMNFLGIHMKRLQDLMKELQRRKSADMTNFVSKYVDHISLTTRKLSRQNVSEVMKLDKSAMETDFEKNFFWRVTFGDKTADTTNNNGEDMERLSPSEMYTPPQGDPCLIQRKFPSSEREGHHFKKKNTHDTSPDLAREIRSLSPRRSFPNDISPPPIRDERIVCHIKNHSVSNDRGDLRRSPPSDPRRNRSRDPRVFTHDRTREHRFEKSQTSHPPPRPYHLKRKQDHPAQRNVHSKSNFNGRHRHHRTPPTSNNLTNDHVTGYEKRHERYRHEEPGRQEVDRRHSTDEGYYGQR